MKSLLRQKLTSKGGHRKCLKRKGQPSQGTRPSAKAGSHPLPGPSWRVKRSRLQLGYGICKGHKGH